MVVDGQSRVAKVESICRDYLDVIGTNNALKASMQLRDVSQPLYAVLFSKKPESNSIALREDAASMAQVTVEGEKLSWAGRLASKATL